MLVACPIKSFDTLSWIGAIAFPEEIGENAGFVQVFNQGVFLMLDELKKGCEDSRRKIDLLRGYL
jgi:hypothetical protein